MGGTRPWSELSSFFSYYFIQHRGQLFDFVWLLCRADEPRILTSNYLLVSLSPGRPKRPQHLVERSG